MDEDNVIEETASCRTTSTQELQHLNEKFEIFRRASDLVFHSNKEQSSSSNNSPCSHNSTNVCLATLKSLGTISQTETSTCKDQI